MLKKTEKGVRVETPNGDLTIKETLQKNWQQNKTLILYLIGTMLLGILFELSLCLNHLIEFGNGETWALFFKGMTGTIITTGMGIIGMIFGVSSQDINMYAERMKKKEMETKKE